MTTKDPWWDQKGGDDFDGINGVPSPYVNDSADADSSEAQQAAEAVQHIVRQFIAAQRQNFANSQIPSYNAVMELPMVRVQYRNFNGQENIRFSPTPAYPSSSSSEANPQQLPTQGPLCCVVFFNDNQWSVFDMDDLPAFTAPSDLNGNPLLNTFQDNSQSWANTNSYPMAIMQLNGVILSNYNFQNPASEFMAISTTFQLGNMLSTTADSDELPILNVSSDGKTAWTSFDIYTVKNGQLQANGSASDDTFPFSISPDGDYFYDPSWAYTGYVQVQPIGLGPGFLDTNFAAGPEMAALESAAQADIGGNTVNSYDWTQTENYFVGGFLPSSVLTTYSGTEITSFTLGDYMCVYAELTNNVSIPPYTEISDVNLAGTAFVGQGNGGGIGLTLSKIATTQVYYEDSSQTMNSGGKLTTDLSGVLPYPVFDPTQFVLNTEMINVSADTGATQTAPVFIDYLVPYCFSPSGGQLFAIASGMTATEARAQTGEMLVQFPSGYGGGIQFQNLIYWSTGNPAEQWTVTWQYIDKDTGAIDTGTYGGTQAGELSTGSITNIGLGPGPTWEGADAPGSTFPPPPPGVTPVVGPPAGSDAWAPTAQTALKNYWVGGSLGATVDISTVNTWIADQSDIKVYSGDDLTLKPALHIDEFDFTAQDDLWSKQLQLTVGLIAFPPSVSGLGYYYTIDTHENGEFFGEGEIHYAQTPFGQYDTTPPDPSNPSQSPALYGWLHVANNQHWLQGYGISDVTQASVGQRHLYLDGQDILQAMATACQCDPLAIAGVLFDIPYGIASEL